MNYFFIILMSLLSVNSWCDDSILSAGKTIQDLRLMSQKNPKNCLSCKIINNIKGSRTVVYWTEDCGSSDSLFSYYDGGGYTSLQCKNSAQDPGFVIRPGLDLKSKHDAENLFVSTTISQDEYINSISGDLIQIENGLYSFKAFDAEGEEEGEVSLPLCLGNSNVTLKDKIISAEVIDYGNNLKEGCALLILKKE